MTFLPSLSLPSFPRDWLPSLPTPGEAYSSISTIFKSFIVLSGMTYWAISNQWVFTAGVIAGLVFDEKVYETSLRVKAIVNENMFSRLSAAYFGILTLKTARESLAFFGPAAVMSYLSFRARQIISRDQEQTD